MGNPPCWQVEVHTIEVSLRGRAVARHNQHSVPHIVTSVAVRPALCHSLFFSSGWLHRTANRFHRLSMAPIQHRTDSISRMTSSAAGLVILLAGSVAAAEVSLQQQYTDTIWPILQQHCVRCHNPDDGAGGVDLQQLRQPESIIDELRLWQTLLHQVRDEEMPPEEPLPSAAQRQQIVDWVERAIADIDWQAHATLGRVTLPRLTKQEYGNTLRDLLGIDLQPQRFLLDDGPGSSGFTNDRDSLFIPPVLAEQYVTAADVTLGAILDLSRPELSTTLEYEAETLLMTERRTRSQELPGGGTGYVMSVGQQTVYGSIDLPADGWYRLTVRFVGVGGESGLRLRIDNQARADFHCQDSRPQEESVELLLRKGSHQFTWNMHVPDALRKLKKASDRRRQQLARRPNDPKLPEDAAERVTAACRQNTPAFPLPADASGEIIQLIHRLNKALGGMQRRIEYLRLVTPAGAATDLQEYFNLLPERTAVMAGIKRELAVALNVPVAEINDRLTAANREKLAANEKVVRDSLARLEIEWQPGFLLGDADLPPPPTFGSAGLDWFKIQGPLLPVAAAADRVTELFAANRQPSVMIADFLARAFRRPVMASEIDRYTALTTTARDRGESVEEALRLAYTAALTSPHFIFRDELGPTTEAFRLNDHQLASRLSYFLWLSMPDDNLRALADAGRLTDPVVLRGQVQRMLNDPRLRAFVETFIGEWLGTESLGTAHQPDAKTFPEFSESLATAMKLEPVLLFEHLLQTGGSLLELLDGRQTFVHSPLASHYGIEAITGTDTPRQVVLHDDRRGGLLGMAAVLTASSTPNRTSPVLRGKWVLENLLGRTLAEPPADAGQLDDRAGRRGKTLREELALHRRDASCAVCHDRIDPIGFGLECFDAIGRIRESQAGQPFDTRGSLPGGRSFDGPADLRALLATEHRDEFISHLIRRLLAFALGRSLRVEDEGLVRAIHQRLEHEDFRADTLVEAIVLSDAFRNQGPALIDPAASTNGR